jgi:tight adherence protein B
VTPTTRAGAGDFGVMVLVDQNSSMAHAPLAGAIRATRSLASQRSAQQELGLITFDSTPTVFVPLSSNPQAISSGLAGAPWTGSGANVPAAISAALGQLANARVALGAIVVVSDGVGRLTAAKGPTPAAVQAAAAAANVPIFTVGLKDSAATAASLQALSQAAPGQFVQSAASGLKGVLQKISSTLTRSYVVRWRSGQRAGQTVNLTAGVTGVPGRVDASYKVPPAPAAAKSSTARPPARPSVAPSRLSSAPSFAIQSDPLPQSPLPRATAPPSFWATSTGEAIVAIIFGLLIAVAVALAVYSPSRHAVRTRVGRFIPGAADIEEAPQLGPRPSRSRLLRIVEKRKWWPPFVENVGIARSPRTPLYLYKRAAVIGLVVALLLRVVSGSLLFALIPLVGWGFVLRYLIKRAANKEREKFKDTLPSYLQDLASALRVGRSFISAIASVAEGADEPVRGELDHAVTDEALGRPIDESLQSIADRMQDPDMEQVALIAALNRRSGSNVSEALDRVAEGARERADMRREIKALTAQAKMSSSVLTALPGVLLLGLVLISPVYAYPLLHTTVGKVLLGVGATMVFCGWKVLKKISTVQA